MSLERGKTVGIEGDRPGTELAQRPPTPSRPRIDAVDVVRGIIMVVMALDHARDYFGFPGDNPTDLARASTALFLTRWVTYFCAPVFFLLTGTGARLSLARRTRAGLSRFLLTRGAWLMVFELTVMRWLGYQFNADYRVTMLLVLWALGGAMITLSILVWLPTPAILGIGLLLVTCHNLLDGVASASPLWAILHAPGFVFRGEEHVVFVAYPLVPWIGVTAAGYALGSIYEWEAARRRAFLLRVGIGVTAAFLVIRGLDGYGDPSPWAAQATAARTVLSFLSTTKYPPSLSFLLMTLGPALLLLRATDGGTPSWLRPARVIGKVPMFYYVLHFFLIHALAVVGCWALTGSARAMFESPDLGHYPFTAPPGWGFSLPVVYAVWAAVVLATYGPCRWFAGVKQRRSDAWLSYF
jgi:uncharacterized membrane protein